MFFDLTGYFKHRKGLGLSPCEKDTNGKKNPTYLIGESSPWRRFNMLENMLEINKISDSWKHLP